MKINISGFKFDPATVTVKVGATVTWTNQDSANHTVTGDDGSWTSESLAKGATFSFTFDKAGTYAYHCAVHSLMKGNIVVQ
jgi:plastocyanin